MEKAKTNLLGLDRIELSEYCKTLGEKPFRGKQLYSWIYRKAETDIAAMTDLAKDFRSKLAEKACVTLPGVEFVQETRDKSTMKFRFVLTDGKLIESVLMRESSRTTLCVSSQIGCALDCKFCATGNMGFSRNLTVSEIIGQYLAVLRYAKSAVWLTGIANRPQPKNEDTRLAGEHKSNFQDRAAISNIVFMGMGEPLLNYDNVLKAILLFTDSEGMAVSNRRITLSTAGIVPGIERLARDRPPCKLAISLNAPDDKLRSESMPINKKYPLAELFRAAEKYEKTTRHRITYEYVLLGGVNDSLQHARRLKRTLGGITAKLNLIEYNALNSSPVNHNSSGFRPPAPGTAERFARELERPGLAVMIRKSLGEEISAACGQLCVT